MPMTAMQSRGLAAGEMHQLAPALIAAAAPRAVIATIASGDHEALQNYSVKSLGVTGAQTAAIASGDHAQMSNRLLGKF